MANNKLEYTLSLKDLFSKKMRDAVGSTEALDKKMSSLGSKIAGIAAGIGVGSLVKSMIEVGSSFELAEVQLTTLLKSSYAAKEVFADLQKESTTSPFGFDTLLKGNAALISTGLSAKDAKKDFNSLANAISATGGNEDALQRMVFNLQQIKNVGASSALDIKQFGYAGINIYTLLSKYYAKNHIALKNQKADYEQITGALQLASEKGGQYFGALANASNTTAGRISNLKDSLMVMAGTIFEQLKPAINGIVSGLTSMMSWVGKNISGIIFWTKVLIPMVLLWKIWASRIVIATIATKAYTVATELSLAWEIARAEGLGIVTAAQWALNVAMNANPIGIVITLIGGLVAILGVLWMRMKSIEELHNESLAKNTQQAYKSEAESIEFLAGKYEKLGYSKEKALSKSVGIAEKTLGADLASLKSQDRNSMSESQKRIYDSQLNSLGGRGQAIRSAKMGGVSSLSGSSGGGSGSSKSSSMGSGVDVTGQRPQSLTINITKLVEALNINTSNITEGYAKIKEGVSKALLEAVNDVNLMQTA